VDGVEAFRHFFGHAQALLRDDAQAFFLEFRVDFARQVAARGVGLDD
jgi:hypothetical protein